MEATAAPDEPVDKDVDETVELEEGPEETPA